MSESRFGAVLAKVRERQGFSSAHSFYSTCSGRSHFKMTFRNYLNVEQGSSLPKPERLEAIVAALGVGEHSPDARELALAYLTEMGLSKILRYVEDVGPARAGKETGLLEEAVRKAIQPQMVHLSREQWSVVASSYEAYVCEFLLQTTLGGLSIKELARAAGFSPSAVKSAIAGLRAAGLAGVRGERVSHVFEGKIVEALPKIPETVGLWSKLAAHKKRLVADGRPVQESMGTVRLTRANLKKLRHELDRFMLAPFIYEDPRPSSDSAVYMVRADILELFPARR